MATVLTSTPVSADTATTKVELVKPDVVVVSSAEPKKEEESQVYNYVFIGILTVVLVFLLYYAYLRFSEQSIAEPYVKGLEQERDDPVIDFNLREAIKELQNIQRNVMKTLSENSMF